MNYMKSAPLKQSRTGHALSVALEFLFPSGCQVCATPLRGAPTPWFCGPCWAVEADHRVCFQCGDFLASETVTRVPEWRCGACMRAAPPFARARVLGGYDGLYGHAVRLLKYREKTSLANYLAGRIRPRAYPDGFWDVDLVMPVPLHPSRLRERGFNQSARLAAAVGRRMGLPVAGHLLERTVATASQVGLKRRERLRNVARAFAVCDTDSVAGKSVLLVDDVITTGATLSACARALMRAGAVRVNAWAVARQTAL
ncbi:MAG: ComF family protein [Nitrospirota bacterium]|nr:ComF family protein [Nitrospirota bacterium]